MVWNNNQTKFDRNLAIVIGIDRYKNHPSIRNLSTAVSDATAIADLLEQVYDYRQSSHNPAVIRLLNEEATLAGLQHVFSQTLIEHKLTERDRLIVYFAGHGLPRSNKDGPEGYLVPHDADPDNPDSFLAMKYVSDALSKLACHHLLIILDCCFAGTFQWAGSRKAIPVLETISREHYYHFIRYPAWQVITSSAHDQEALDTARLKEDNRQTVTGEAETPFARERHSPFALALLEGLHPGDGLQRVKADLSPDGVVTAHELFVYLQKRVKELSGEQQDPGLYPLRRDYDKGEFIFTPPEFDPEKALAAALPLNEDNNPYRGLNSFDEKHAKFFFGRQALVDELKERLSNSDRALTVVLGISGSGKSSLVKAGLLPRLRNRKTEQQTEQQAQQWYILDPMRPGELPFTSLGRVLLPVVNPELLEQVAQDGFLDKLLKKEQTQTKQDPLSVIQDQCNEIFVKVADLWNQATPEARLLLVEDYFDQLKTLVKPQQQEQIKQLYEQILETLNAVSEKLQNDSKYFSHAIATWSQQHPGVKLLLVIDQFEELLTTSQDKREPVQSVEPESAKVVPQNENQPEQQSQKRKEWQTFLDVLRVAIAEQPQTLHLVLTLRSDFEPRFLNSPLEPYWKAARFTVQAMNQNELRQAIENPALKQALYFEELTDDSGNPTGNLVNKLIDEVGQMPGALPLLSFTLSELYVSLYERWKNNPNYTDRTLRFQDYEDLGGVAGALSRRANQEYEALDENHRATLRRVMLRMVAIDGAEVARRRVSTDELRYPSLEENQRVALVIDRLVKARLLVKGQEKEAAYIEPAHDYLINGWARLTDWIRQERANLVLQRELTTAANNWDRKKKSNEKKKAVGFLWDRDPRLPQLEQIQQSKDNWFNGREARFVESSTAQRRKRIRNRRTLVSAIITVLSIFSGYVWYQLQISQIREKAARAENLLRTDPVQGLVLAIQATGQNRSTPLVNRKILPEVQSSLLNAVQSARERNLFVENTQVIAVALTPDGNKITSSYSNGDVYLQDLQDSRPRQIFENNQTPIRNLAFSPDGSLLIAVGISELYQTDNSELQPVKFWSLEENKQIDFFGSYGSNIASAAFSFDGKLVVSGGEDGIIRLWNLQGDLISQNSTTIDNSSQSSPIQAVAFSADEKFIVSAKRNGDVHLWQLQGSEIVESPALLGQCANPISINFNLSGQQIICNQLPDYSERGFYQQSFVKVFNHLPATINLSSKWEELSLNSRSSGFLSKTLFASFIPESDVIASSDQDGSIYLWKVANKETTEGTFADIPPFEEVGQPFLGHSSSIESIAFSLDGTRMISGSHDGSIRIWDLEQSLAEEQYFGNQVLGLSRDGKKIILSSKTGTSVKEVGGKEIGHFSEKVTFLIGISPNGREILDKDRTRLNLLYLDGRPKKTLIENEYTWAADFSPDGKKIAAGLSDNRVHLWDIQGNLIGKPIEIRDDFSIQSLVFSSDGKQIVTGGSTNYSSNGASSQSSVCLLDVGEDGLDNDSQKCELIPGELTHVSFSPDRKMVAIGQTDGGLYLWNLQTNQFGQRFGGDGHPVLSIAFNSNSKTLAIGDREGRVRLWNLNGNPISDALRSSNKSDGSVSSVAFNDDKNLIVGYSYGAVEAWNLSWEISLGVACSRLFDHPVLNEPSTEEAKESKNICQKYVWDPRERQEISIGNGNKILISALRSFDKQAGVEAFRNGDFESAIKHLESHLQNQPNDPEALIYSNNAKTADQQNYTIAVSVPIGSDVDGSLEMLRGVAQAQDEINKLGGVNGVPLRVLIADDHNDPDTAKQVAEALVDNAEVLGIVGHYASDVTQATGEIYKAGKVAAISPVSTSVKLSELNSILRTVPSDAVAAKALADYMEKQLQRKKAVVFYNSKSGYSQSLNSEFSKSLSKAGGEVIEEFDLSDPDFNAEQSLEQAIERGSEVIVLLPNTAELNDTFQIIKANNQRLPLLGGDDVYTLDTLRSGSSAAEGMVVAVPWHVLASQTDFPETSGALWGGATVNWRTAMTYDATIALIEGIKANPTREGLAEALRQPDFTAFGATGEVQFDAAGDRKEGTVQLVKIEPGNRAKAGYDFVPIP